MPHLSRTSPLWMCTTSLLLMALSSPSPLGRPASAEQDHHQQLPVLVWVSLGWLFVKSASRCILLCRYGIAPAQFKAFMDATGQLWQSGALVGKPVTFITSTASLGGGQEVTILSSKPCSLHTPDNEISSLVTNHSTSFAEQCKTLNVNGSEPLHSPQICSPWLLSSQ